MRLETDILLADLISVSPLRANLEQFIEDECVPMSYRGRTADRYGNLYGLPAAACLALGLLAKGSGRDCVSSRWPVWPAGWPATPGSP